MFRYERAQSVCDIGGIKVGGQPGENPPLLIGSMFQKGDVLLDSRKNRRFDRQEAARRIRELENISQETGIPGMIAMVANSVDEMKTYIDFYTSVTELPFAIDIWMQEVRLEVVRHISDLGLGQRVLYNSITPWDTDIVAQVAELKELGIQHIVLQVFDTEDKHSTGRLSSLKKMLPLVEQGDFNSILVDTAVMNLPATGLSLMANHLIKKEYGLPVGEAPSNGSYMWRKSAGPEANSRFVAMDSGVHAVSALISDFLFYGPLTGTARVFSAVAAATSIMAALVFEESNLLPVGDHPLSRLFPDVLQQFSDEKDMKNDQKS